jgi:hypothetical protein
LWITSTKIDSKYLASCYRMYFSISISSLSCASNTATLCISIKRNDNTVDFVD